MCQTIVAITPNHGALFSPDEGDSRAARGGAAEAGAGLAIKRRGVPILGLTLGLLAALALMVASTPAAALCMPPVEASSAPSGAPVSDRYAWFLIESLAHARLAWEELDNAADSQNAVAQLAGLKLAIEDFQCAASLVQPFQSARGPHKFGPRALRASAALATQAYTTFADVSQRWATTVARGKRLPLDEAADLKVQNEKAGEVLIHAASAAWMALLKDVPEATTPMDRLNLTRAQRVALRDGLKRRSPAAGTHAAITKDTHTPDLAADVLYTGLSNPRYKAADEP